MTQMSTHTLVRWMVRLVGLLVIGYNAVLFLMLLSEQHFPPGVEHHGIALEVAARSVIVLGYAATFRFERLGGAVMILGAALLSVALYAWASVLGHYASTLIAGHCMPVLLAGFLFLTLPHTPEPEVAFET